MNIEINIFTVLEKDLKNVSERSCPIPYSNLKILKLYKLIVFIKTLQRLKQEWQTVQLWDQSPYF